MKFLPLFLLGLFITSCVQDEQLDPCRNYSKLDYSISGKVFFNDEPIAFDRWHVYIENNEISIDFTKYYEYKTDIDFSLRKLLINDSTFFDDADTLNWFMSLCYSDCDVITPCVLFDDSISSGYGVVKMPNSSDIKIYVEGNVTLNPWVNNWPCEPDTPVFVKMEITLKEN